MHDMFQQMVGGDFRLVSRMHQMHAFRFANIRHVFTQHEIGSILGLIKINNIRRRFIINGQRNRLPSRIKNDEVAEEPLPVFFDGKPCL
jgi:hypothetical protein